MKEKEKNNFERYEEIIANLITKTLLENEEDIKQGKVVEINKNRYEIILFEGFTEIFTVIDTLKLIVTFIKTEPPENSEINYSNYLNYHIHNYFQEMYILKERIKTYATKVYRKYQKVTNIDLIDRTKETIIRVTDSLNTITGDRGIRNIHVHEKKYTDDNLNWLSSTTFLVKNNHIEYTSIQSEIYIETRNKWIETIENNNKFLMDMLDNYFKVLTEIIYKDKEVINPN